MAQSETTFAIQKNGSVSILQTFSRCQVCLEPYNEESVGELLKSLQKQRFVSNLLAQKGAIPERQWSTMLADVSQ